MPKKKNQKRKTPNKETPDRPERGRRRDVTRTVGTSVSRLVPVSLSSVTIRQRSAGPDVALVEAYVLPASDEYIESVKFYNDDGGNPGNYIADLVYVETNGAGEELWDIFDNELAPPYPENGETYWVVATAIVPVPRHYERNGVAG